MIFASTGVVFRFVLRFFRVHSHHASEFGYCYSNSNIELMCHSLTLWITVAFMDFLFVGGASSILHVLLHTFFFVP